MLDRFRTTTPLWCVAFAFALTTILARWVSHVNPEFHFDFHGMHIHHYMYGIFIITLAGYGALVFKGPRATFWLALLYGWGLGFTFDEMAMWLNSSVDGRLRWDHNGLTFAILAMAAAGLLTFALRKKAEASGTNGLVLNRYIERENNRLEKIPIDAVAAEED